MTRVSILVLLAACATEPAAEPEPAPAPEPVAEPEPAPEPVAEDGVYFANLEDGARVTSPVHVVMGVRGMEVEPAGEIHEGKGHHHILVDLDPIEAGTVIPSTDQHIHFGGGQTEADVVLSPGQHKLTLQFANGMHESYGPEWSASIKVEVVAAPMDAAPPADPDAH